MSELECNLTDVTGENASDSSSYTMGIESSIIEESIVSDVPRDLGKADCFGEDQRCGT